MKKKYKILLVALLVIMTLGVCIPATAASSPVVRIGKKEYGSLEYALKVVKKGQTITLLCDINMYNQPLVANKNAKYTINFNKKKVTNCAYLDIRTGKVTLKNGTFNTHKETIVPGEYYRYGRLSVFKNAKVTLSNMKCTADLQVNRGGTLIVNSGTYNKGSFYNNGTTELKGGTFKNWQVIMNTAKMYIKKGTYQLKGSFDSGWCIMNEEGTLTISGGTFKIPSGYERVVNYGKLKIKRSIYGKVKRSLHNEGTLKKY